MTPRERFQAAMNFRPYDQLPILEWASWWDQTIARWHQEGLPAAVKDKYDICRHLGVDLYFQDWARATCPTCPGPAGHGQGIIGNLADYHALRPHLYPEPQSIINENRWRQWAGLQQQGQAVTWFTLEGFFWFPRRLLGIEPHFYAFYDQPQLMHQINEDLTQWMLAVIEHLLQISTPDFMTFAEDMSYNHGPMLSRALFDEFLAPYYRRVTPVLQKAGIRAIIDSDGDVTEPAAWFESVGLDGILPLERQAGVDIAQLRRRHPRMLFIGHFDKMTMNRGEAAMRREFERVLPTAAAGGFLPSCDHQTPPGVSLSQYQLYLSLFREYAVEAGRLSQQVLTQV